MNIYPHSSVGDLSCLRDQMNYPNITIREPTKTLPLKWYESHPCMGKKILCFFFEPNSANELSFVLTGARFYDNCYCLTHVSLHPFSLTKNSQETRGIFGMTWRRPASRARAAKTTATIAFSRTWMSLSRMASNRYWAWW